MDEVLKCPLWRKLKHVKFRAKRGWICPHSRVDCYSNTHTSSEKLKWALSLFKEFVKKIKSVHLAYNEDRVFSRANQGE